MSGLLLHVILSEAAPWSWVLILECASSPAPPHDPTSFLFIPQPPHPHPSLPWPHSQAGRASTEPSLKIPKHFINWGFRPCLNTTGVAGSQHLQSNSKLQCQTQTFQNYKMNWQFQRYLFWRQAKFECQSLSTLLQDTWSYRSSYSPRS